MNDKLLAAIMGIMSIVVALEGIWLSKRVLLNGSLAKLKNKTFETILGAIYFLGLPYLALVTGLLPARFFGLKGLDTIHKVELNIFVSILTQIGNVLLTWIPDFGPTASMTALLGGFYLICLFLYLHIIKTQKTSSISNIYNSKIEILFDVIHWSFYRAIVWLIFNDLYLAVIGGGFLNSIEYILSSRLGKVSNALQQRYIFRVALGIITAVIFLFAPNLWLIFVVHLILTISTKAILNYYQHFLVPSITKPLISS